MAKGHILIDEEMCKGCEFCTTVCPYELVEMAEFYNSKGYKPAQLKDPDGRCTGCMLCAMICPDAVITVYRVAGTRPSPSSQSTELPVARIG